MTKTATKVSASEKKGSNKSTSSSKSVGDLSKASSLMPPTHRHNTNGQTAQLVNPTLAQSPQGTLTPKDANYLGGYGTLKPKEKLSSFAQSKLTPKTSPKANLRRKARPETPKAAPPKKEEKPTSQPTQTPTPAPEAKTQLPTPQGQPTPTQGKPEKANLKPPAPPKAQKVAAKKVVTNQPSADKIIGFSQLSATQMAAQHDTLDKEVKEGLQQDKAEAQKAMQPLEAKLQGAEKAGNKKLEVKTKEAGHLREERREADPGAPRLAEHQHHTDAPPKAQLPEKEEKGFFSRLFGGLSDLWKSLTDMTDLVPVADAGINAQAGKAPQTELKGPANPARANEQRTQRDEEVDKEKDRLKARLRQHPGPDNVQPQKLDEKVEVPAVKTEIPDVEAQANEQMKDYLAAQVPPEARQLADERMEEILEPKLAEPRGKLEKEVGKQKQRRTKALADKDRDLKKLNDRAQADQEEKVKEVRHQMKGEVERSAAESERLVAEYKTTASERHQEMSQQVEQRAADDNAQAQRKVEQGTREAESIKEGAEKEAREAREKAKDRKRDRSLLSRAGEFLSDVWDKVTSVVKTVFERARKLIKTVIDKAKKAAIALIELGRKAIVGLINKFKTFLKDLVNTYLAERFPALAKALNQAIDKLADLAVKAVNKVADLLKKGVELLAKNLAEAIDSVLAALQEGVLTYLSIVGAVMSGDFGKALKIIFLSLCQLAGIEPKVVMDFLAEAGDLITTIFKDPLTFLSNALSSVKMGLGNFMTNILQHLGKGLLSWLTGAMGNLNLKMPEKFDLMGILSVTMQVLGLTYDNIKARAIKKLDEYYPSKGAEIIGKLEQTAGIVREVMRDGPKALWKHLEEFVGNLQQTIMGGIQSFVTERLVKAGIELLISMATPVGGVVKVLKTVYDFIMFIVDNIERIFKFVKTVFKSVADIAAGKLDNAAKMIESVLAQTIPMILDFLARLLNMGGISKKIQEIMERIRKPINKGIDKVLELVIRLAKKVVDGITGKSKKKKKGADGTPSERKEAAKKEFIEKFKANGGKMRKWRMRRLLKRLRVDYKLSKVTLEGTKKAPKVAFYASPATYLPLEQPTAAEGEYTTRPRNATTNATPTANGQKDDIRATHFDKGIQSPRREAMNALNHLQGMPTGQPNETVPELTGTIASRIFKLKNSIDERDNDDFDRPGKVEARMSQIRTRRRGGGKTRDTSVGHFGQDERMIQGHPVEDGFYNGGHLVGDVLMDSRNSFDMFKYWNLAPQFRNFNYPEYFSGIERPVRDMLAQPSTSNQANVVDYKVEVRYPNSTYSLKLSALVQNLLNVKPSNTYLQKAARALTFDPNLDIDVTMSRRIPNYWKATARRIQGTGTFDGSAGVQAGTPTSPSLQFTNNANTVDHSASYNPTTTNEEGIYRLRVSTSATQGRQTVPSPAVGQRSTFTGATEIEFEGRQQTF
jgi:hypothetical protein